ncbi:MAG: tetratricopeptide repeat protein [Desulfobacteraceae bacterium]|nr:tetratricopeptide repeat protein [Desulfobacteraceae bacterium]
MTSNRSSIILFFVVGGLLFYGCAAGGKKYANDFFDQGVVWFQKGEYDRAIDDFTKALEMAPEGRESYIVYYNRGVAYYKNRDYDQAIQDFNTSLQLTPGERPTGKYKPAIYDSSMEIKPATAKIAYEIFNVYKVRGDAWFYKEGYRQAIDDYSMALEYGAQRKELPSVYDSRGWARFESGDFDGAIEDFSTALSINSRLAQAYFGRARAWSEKGDVNMALRDAWMAHKLRPDSREYDDLVFDLRSSKKK